MLRVAILYVGLFISVLAVADAHGLPQLADRIHEVPLLDKVLHFLLFGLLALVTNLALVCRSTKLRRTIVIGGAIALIVATVEEYSNRFIAVRDWSLGDLAAYYLGVLCLGVLPFLPRALARREAMDDAETTADVAGG